MYGRRDSAKFEAIVDVVVAEREPTPPHFRKRQQRGKKADETAIVPFDDALADAPDALAALTDASEVAPPAGNKRPKKKAAKAGGGFA